MNKLTQIRLKRKLAELDRRIISDEMDLMDPKTLQYGIRILSFKPILPNIPGWVKASSPRKLENTDLYSILYRSMNNNWDEAINHIKKTYGRDIHRCIPELFLVRKIDPEADEIFRRKQQLKERSLTTTKSGRLRKTKYVYPDNCISSHDRALYRRKMRRLNRKED